MKNNRWMIIIILVTGLMISACSQEEALPTAITFPTDIPPTEAPQVAPEITATLTATPGERATLPPTWTNTPIVTDTSEPVEEVPTSTPLQIATPNSISPACDAFQANPDLSTKEFIIGEAPTAAWTAVDGAVLYHVFLYDFNSKIINDQIYTEDTFWVFDRNHFELGENYIWAVWPLDAIGDQMCYERGLELLPQRKPIGS